MDHGSTAPHNEADVTFATAMIVHHAQAVEMTELAQARSANPRVQAVAGLIKAFQQPEIGMMTGWLRAWGKPVHAGLDNSGGHSPAGMVTGDEMTALKASSGNAFDRMFLELMIRHYEGALAMAATEQAQGSNPDAKAFATQVIIGQTAEIDVMKDLLADI